MTRVLTRGKCNSGKRNLYPVTAPLGLAPFQHEKKEKERKCILGRADPGTQSSMLPCGKPVPLIHFISLKVANFSWYRVPLIPLIFILLLQIQNL